MLELCVSCHIARLPTLKEGGGFPIEFMEYAVLYILFFLFAFFRLDILIYSIAQMGWLF